MFSEGAKKGVVKLSRLSRFIGVLAGVTSIVLWGILNFFNPYSGSVQYEPLMTTLFTLFLPACLAVVAAIKAQQTFMLIAFIWSMPISLYLAFSPGIFALFGVTSLAYLISYLMMRSTRMKKESEHR
jgi:drug/metabolite transporter (DMT)-like permease